MDKSPIVSVIMPAYQAQATLAQSAESLIAQTYKRWELLLVVDRNSHDQTESIAEAYATKDTRIRVVKDLPQGGCAYNRNEAIQRASGDFIAFLDSDDLWLPQKLEKQVALMQSTGADLGYTGYAQMDWRGEKLPQVIRPPSQLTYIDLLSDNQLGCLTAMIRRSAFPELKFEDHLHEDLILWLRLLRTTTARGLPEPLAVYRQARGSRSGNKLKAALARWRVLRQFENLPLHRAINCFMNYAVAALKKRNLSSLAGT